jgi:hypothetical protein
MSPEDISSLPISMLKTILFQNHVNARLLIEKTDLIDKIKNLISEERRQRERAAMFAEAEAEADRQRQQERLEELERERQPRPEQPNSEDSTSISAVTMPDSPEITVADGDDDDADGTTTPTRTTTITTITPETVGGEGEVPSPDEDGFKSPSTPPRPQQPQATMSSMLERTGLCVICQDEEANIAIVDCGYVLKRVIKPHERAIHISYLTTLQTYGDVQNLLRSDHGL